MSSDPSARPHRAGLALFLCTVLSFLTQGLAPRPAWSATGAAGNLVFILDASGSMAAKVQGQPKDETTIVLVSDGEETCNGDPCALVKALKASGIKFVMHVVGFDVGEKEKAQLACIAAAGGGTYFTAKNASELASAAKTVAGPTADSAGRLKVKALRNGKPIGAWYDIYPSGVAPESGHSPLAANPIADDGEIVKLLPGTYDLEITNHEDAGNPLLHFPGIVIEAGKTVQKVAEFSGGSLRMKARQGGRPIGAWYEVFKAGAPADEERQAVASNPLGDQGETVKLPPGTYDLVIKNMADEANPVANFPGIVIEAGKVVERSGEF